ncbi:MAG: hypothetical protein KIH10_17740, partial [Candidatus Freyarchaeota archaeon]|nr:hypothetical protein [Candidatus Jordarchaeia archaeon]
RKSNFNHNGTLKKITSRRDYYIKYTDAKHVLNSILIEVRRHANRTYTLTSKSFAVKTKVKVHLKDIRESTLLFGAMKLLDALETKYYPESVRLVKA